MCGEKGLPTLRYSPQSGSPPHVRGKVPGIREGLERVGITPACAGKRVALPVGGSALEDHPRTCGEKAFVTRTQAPKLGSPPHVRGKVSQFVDLLCGDGITPAYAGKSARAAMLGNKV